MDPAALFPKSRGTQLAPLREQLDGIESTQQSEESQNTELVGGVLNDYPGNFRLGGLKEAQISCGLHKVFDSPARSLVCPLKIHHLPDELLMGIFRHLRNCDDIKRLRLSSKRINMTSSHLLINTLHVSPIPKSLERLDEVSRHPTISRGVRRLVASVDAYTPDLARDVQTFSERCVDELLNLDVPYPASIKANLAVLHYFVGTVFSFIQRRHASRRAPHQRRI